MNIILCGLPMSGKTTIGIMAAKKMNWNFIDTDKLIETAYGAHNKKKYTCRQIFAKEGELLFRNLEIQQIASLPGTAKSVISVGGGTLNDRRNTKILKSIGKVIYLKTPINMLWERVQRRGIPAYLDPADPENAFYELAKKRSPLYEEAANFIIETDGLSKHELMDAIINIRKIAYGE